MRDHQLANPDYNNTSEDSCLALSACHFWLRYYDGVTGGWVVWLDEEEAEEEEETVGGTAIRWQMRILINIRRKLVSTGYVQRQQAERKRVEWHLSAQVAA